MDQHSGQGESDFQATDTAKPFRYKSGISGKLTFEQVNEVTWKLTDGTMTNVRLAWTVAGLQSHEGVGLGHDVGTEKPAWIARHKNQTTNPMQLQKAKKAAMAMAKGECGDYVVRDPIAHLNGLAAGPKRSCLAGAPLTTYHRAPDGDGLIKVADR